MKIDEKDVDKIGRLTIPFVLAIFLALLLEDIWQDFTLEQKALLMGFLITTTLVIYRKKVRAILR